ncbi:hypothetical protein BO94DRAFT_325128 [Aspergillus sclerotioniger CBS 115572]|uniref:Uncharacterized protein n=1 Tax=Aspergillus sclerotioniger CBS 115572 TaxID=1450535 RepID=A0A317X6M7_9EURO|nr:hypothetical protein BO94DRAFT_325128 [Aspergillus sclerotioniger CBS 115572]PWY94223.1 hypothetical protein BO94DRAFT_325128 [Aspergillus sclerotioniger CBS 115572]
MFAKTPPTSQVEMTGRRCCGHILAAPRIDLSGVAFLIRGLPVSRTLFGLRFVQICSHSVDGLNSSSG